MLEPKHGARFTMDSKRETVRRAFRLGTTIPILSNNLQGRVAPVAAKPMDAVSDIPQATGAVVAPQTILDIRHDINGSNMPIIL